MSNLVRLESMTIEGIKNVEHGELSFDELSKIKNNNLNDLHSVLGIYGQNGSGKTAALEAAKILKDILSELIDTRLVRFEVLRVDATASIAVPYYRKTMKDRIKIIVDNYLKK